ncbi:class I SAM-dependent methyltransferase [Spiribacter halobius]|uniref:class I SAM-dependent methyltransferase n=1 Tax=Sediminicurvatus halobius TaxID=2182432 RepID=UPI0026BFDB4A|nr:SAM-dependent methyltransferase [Spiribacter halobius]
MPRPPDLPTPDADARAHSEALRERLVRAVRAAGGALDFERFMALALYAPGLGYYSAGQTRFGAGGDFTTAPLMSDLFARTLARETARVLAAIDGDTVLELGAGSGRMAVDVLRELARLDAAPARYLILEVSADLRAAQAEALRELPEGLRKRVLWLDRLPAEPIRGAILANEVMDALPVRRFQRGEATVEALAVGLDASGGFTWVPQPADAALAEAVAAIERERGERLPAGYVSEWCPSLAPWVAALADALEAGAALLVDYGYPRGEYYHPQRGMGTLLCHYRHRAHDDPFLWPGLQDITASVDFTLAARAGTEAGLDLLGFTTQAHFLAGAGLPALLEADAAGDPGRAAELAQQAKPLLFPGEMGERFKVLGLARGLGEPTPGFAFVDHRDRLAR